jgi:hypothetical protein
MLGQIWAVLRFLAELWEQIKVALGLIEKAKHESAKEEIKEQTDIIANPDSTEEQTHEAAHELEKELNKRS